MTADKRKRAQRSADEIECIGAAYCDRMESVAGICRRFKTNPGKLVEWANVHGWPLRGMGAQRPGAQKSRTYRQTPKPRTEAQQRADRQAEEAARDAALYRGDLTDVDYLRSKGFGIDRAGIDPDSEGIRFGNTVISFAALREKAARERRLDGAAKERLEREKGNLPRGDRARLKTSKPSPVATTIRRKAHR